MWTQLLFTFAAKFYNMKIALLTCSEMPDMLPYDMEVIKLLKQKNIESKVLIWDELTDTDIRNLEIYDIVLVRTIWDYYKKVPKFINFMELLKASNVKLLNPIDIINWNMDKKYLQELQNEGFSIIPTIFNYGQTGSFEEALLKGWNRMILKPMISAGSYHTFVLNSADKISFDELISKHYKNRPFMLQEFIPEISEGEISTITLTNPSPNNDEEFSYSVTKIPKTGDYRVQVDYGGMYSIGNVDPQIKKISEQITARFEGKLLYQRLDGLWRDGKFLIMEIELIEPDLYLNYSKEALNCWVDNIVSVVNTLSTNDSMSE